MLGFFVWTDKQPSKEKKKKKKKSKEVLFNYSELICHIIYQPRRGVAFCSVLSVPGGFPSILTP